MGVGWRETKNREKHSSYLLELFASSIRTHSVFPCIADDRLLTVLFPLDSMLEKSYLWSCTVPGVEDLVQ